MPPEPSPRQSAEERFRRGDLAGCLKDLQSAVRKEPADAKLRIFLAQVLMVHGDWDRALSQLKLVSEVDGQRAADVACVQHGDPVRTPARRRLRGRSQPAAVRRAGAVDRAVDAEPDAAAARAACSRRPTCGRRRSRVPRPPRVR